MPQLVKGGKHVFGWSKVDANGAVSLPPEAWIEYKFQIHNEVILTSGSSKSGGFSIISLEKFLNSSISKILNKHYGTLEKELPRNKIFQHNNRNLFIMELKEQNIIKLNVEILNEFGVNKNTKLLAVRGSGLGLGLIAKGPIYDEALKHQYLPLYS